MSLAVRQTILGFDLVDGDRPLAVYRAAELLPRSDSPKPCFAPIYTPSGTPVTEYRPDDHTWHTGLFYGWVHANDANLWGGPWYLPESGKYEHVADSHGVQRHDGFDELAASDGGARVRERLTWLDAGDRPLAREQRAYDFRPCAGGYRWDIETVIEPTGERLILGATRAAARYSGLVLRLGPPFADRQTEAAGFRCSEGRQGHAPIMGQQARWVSVSGATGGMVALLDHPGNPRHPTNWHARANLLVAAPLMAGDLETAVGDRVHLRHRLLVLDGTWETAAIEAEFRDFAADERLR